MTPAFLSQLDALGDAKIRLPVWWRDDDATRDGPALQRLLSMAEVSCVPVALAVIPTGAQQSLVDAIAKQPRVTVLQHGFAHINHTPRGHKPASELGDARPLAVVLAEVVEGQAMLRRQFGETALRVLAAPWNQMSDRVATALPQTGIVGASAFVDASLGGTYPGLAVANCHVDPIRWRDGPQFRGVEKSLAILCRQLDLRLAAADKGRIAEAEQPIGLLTHHRDMDEATWRFCHEFLQVLSSHRAVVPVSAREVFL